MGPAGGGARAGAADCLTWRLPIGLQELIASEVPDLRGAARGRVLLIEPESIQGSLRSQLDDPNGVEQRIFAVRAAALVRGKREVYLMDQNGSCKEVKLAQHNTYGANLI